MAQGEAVFCIPRASLSVACNGFPQWRSDYTLAYERNFLTAAW